MCTQNLTTEHIGRLVIYMDVVTSSMYVFNGPVLEHGLVAIPRQMTGGLGKNFYFKSNLLFFADTRAYFLKVTSCGAANR